MSVLRWLPRLVIPLLVAGALLVDARLEPASSNEAVEPPELRTEVTVPPPDALTSSWFCPVVSMRAVAVGRAEAAAELLLTNTTGATASVSVELRGATTGRHFVMTEVPPRSTQTLVVSNYIDDELAGALVEASSGGLAVTRRFVSPLGIDEARCSSLLSDRWYAPGGDTQVDALHSLAIMNPLPRDSIVDVTFATEAEFGPFVAPALRGLVVPAWSTIVIDVGEHARRRDVVASIVEARTGRVAVDSFVAYDGTVGRRGFSAELATATPHERWHLPVPGVDDHTRMWLRVLNPSDDVAEVSAEVITDGANGDRLTFAVASRDVVELIVEAPSGRAPGLTTLLADPGMPFGLAVGSSNGIPIVVWAEVLVGSAANPLTDLPTAQAQSRADDAEQDSRVTTIVAQTDESGPDFDASRPEPRTDGSQDDAVPDEGSPEVSAALIEPVLAARSGLAHVPGIGQARLRWLAVIPAEAGSETVLMVQMDSSEASRRVVVGTLDGHTVAVIDVPPAGVATHRLSSGTTRLLMSDTPFAASVWQATAGGAGLGVAHPVGW